MSGLRIAGELVGGFLVFVLAAVSLNRLISSAPAFHFRAPLTAWFELALATIIIFATAERWGGFIPGFFLLQGITKSAFIAISPVMARLRGVTRSEAAFLALYSLLVLIALWRFIPPRRTPTTVLDRVALTIFALSVARILILPSSSEMNSIGLRAALIGCAPLIVAWAVYLWKQDERRRRHRHSHPVGPESLQESPLVFSREEHD